MAKAKAPESPESASATYTVRMPINHDGIDYFAGDEIALDTAAAAQLLAVNAIEPAAV